MDFKMALLFTCVTAALIGGVNSKDCSDINPSCAYFYKQGYCTTGPYVGWMKGQCAKTCQHCDSIERCASGPCLNGAACEEEGKSFKCTCVNGFVGATCDRNPCQSNPCQNGGKCAGSEAGHYCYCAEGWTGPTCTTALTEEESAVLARHNELRKKVATGQEPSWQVICSNLKGLSWSQDLAKTAQQWADHMASARRMYHDHVQNRRHGSHQGWIGQNIAYRAEWGADEASFNVEEQLLKMVNAWYDEVNDLNGQDPNDYKKNGGTAVIGHFTQVVWEDTHEVGCGVGKRSDGNMHYWYLACNYSPGGNMNVRKNNPCKKD